MTGGKYGIPVQRIRRAQYEARWFAENYGRMHAQYMYWRVLHTEPSAHNLAYVAIKLAAISSSAVVREMMRRPC